MPRQLIAIFALLSIMYGCGPQPASVGPKASEMVGRYTTKDKRAVKTTLDLHGDGTFTLANWPVTNGSGMWKIEQDTVTKMW